MKKIKVLMMVTMTLLMQTACASIDGFTNIGNANWKMSSSDIQANSGSGFLVSKAVYDDFYLKVEFFAEAGTNSGIFFRCTNASAVSDTNCYEANIFDTRPDQTYRTGAITGMATPKAVIVTESNGLHIYEIFAIGDKIKVILDGRETVYLRNSKLTKGHVALQLAQGSIRFRNLEIKPLVHDALDNKTTVLDGVWELESMEVIDAGGKSTPWCQGAFGVILYTKNYMSTAVNCTGDVNKSVLYSGSFEIKGQSVFHHAQNADHPNLIKTHIREFSLKDHNHLELRGALGNSSVVVKWMRR